jgi:hypothetical protein
MCGRGLTERRALKVVGMSASSVRYQPAPDRNAELRQVILTLASRYRRYGVGMIYLKVRQQGYEVHHKRVERIYADAHRYRFDAAPARRGLGVRVSRWCGLKLRTKSGPWISCLIAVRKVGPSSV